MAKKKGKRSRRQGTFSKVINAGLIALGFSNVIKIAIGPGTPTQKIDRIIQNATFGLSQRKFDLKKGLEMYTPVGAAIGLGKLKQYLMKHFPVR